MYKPSDFSHLGRGTQTAISRCNTNRRIQRHNKGVSMNVGHKVTEDEIKAFMALKAENERLKAEAAKPKANGLGIKVSTKGAVSVYGMGRFPITLYASQWQSLLAKTTEISQFIEINKASLKYKDAAGQ
jgi:hypothetical protein